MSPRSVVRPGVAAGGVGGTDGAVAVGVAGAGETVDWPPSARVTARCGDGTPAVAPSGQLVVAASTRQVAGPGSAITRKPVTGTGLSVGAVQRTSIDDVRPVAVMPV